MSHQADKVHFPHVSIRDLLEGNNRSREVKHDLAFARKAGIAIVRAEPGGIEIPAAVTLRTTVTDQTVVGGRVRDAWHVSIAPDSQALRRRLFAEVNATHMGVLDAPVAGIAEASYDAVRALTMAHEGFSALSPPRVGTFVEMTFAIAGNMRPFVTYRPSSVDVLRRARGWAKHHNERAQARWSAAHWPAKGPVHVFGRQIWPWVLIEALELISEPEIPQSDPWEPDGDLYPNIGEVIAKQFYKILESLWKAAFRGDEFVASQLTQAGYRLDQIDATCMGVGSLRELMRRFHTRAHMTMMGSPDLIEDLGDEAIGRLTRGYTNLG